MTIVRYFIWMMLYMVHIWGWKVSRWIKMFIFLWLYSKKYVHHDSWLYKQWIIKREFESQGIVCGMFIHVSYFFLKIKTVTFKSYGFFSICVSCFCFIGVE